MQGTNEALKTEVKQWWEEHPMDYMDWTWDGNLKGEGQIKHFFENIDTVFRKAAFFAQEQNSEFLFSRLIPYQKLAGKRVLEIGCGLGAHAGEMARSGACVTAVDLTEKSVLITKERFKIYGLKGDIRVADAESLPFEDESFDFVWSWGVLHHTPNTGLAIKEIYRVLRREGEARIMIYHKDSLMSFLGIVQEGLKNFLKKVVKHPRTLGQYMQTLRNKYTDGRRIGGSPLAKYFSRNEARSFFGQFEKVTMSTYGQKSELLSFFKRYSSLMKSIERLPDGFFNLIFKRVGFFLFIRAIK